MLSCTMRRWETKDEPDPNLMQLRAIRAELMKRRSIRWVWYEYVASL